MERVDLVVPVKRLAAAKTRLRGPGGISEEHTELALALTRDTVAAACAAARVRSVVVVTADPRVAAVLTADGVDAVDDPLAGLNAAYDRGAEVVRARDPASAVGALQADLPALQPAELDAAIGAALALGGRTFCADADGTGTTFLLAAAGVALQPHFGGGSAARHRASGAIPLDGEWPGLRRDVDTPADLRQAREIGLGPRSRAALASRTP